MFPLQYFAERVAGDLAEVVNLIPAGVEAHDFEPTPADIRTLDGAGLIIYNGSGFEPWMERALRTIDDGHLALEASRDLADGVSGSDDGDPHVWLDPLKAMEQVRSIEKALSEASPANREAYTANAAALIAEIEELDGRFEDTLSRCRLNRFVSSHDAFGYLADRYGLEQIPIRGASPEAEVSPKELARLVDIIRALDVKYVMAEPIVSARLPETLAGEVGATLLRLYTLESLTAEQASRGETYLTLMEANLVNLSTALECEP